LQGKPLIDLDDFCGSAQPAVRTIENGCCHLQLAPQSLRFRRHAAADALRLQEQRRSRKDAARDGDAGERDTQVVGHGQVVGLQRWAHERIG